MKAKQFITRKCGSATFASADKLVESVLMEGQTYSVLPSTVKFASSDVMGLKLLGFILLQVILALLSYVFIKTHNPFTLIGVLVVVALILWIMFSNMPSIGAIVLESKWIHIIRKVNPHTKFKHRFDTVVSIPRDRIKKHKYDAITKGLILYVGAGKTHQVSIAALRSFLGKENTSADYHNNVISFDDAKSILQHETTPYYSLRKK